MDRNALGALLAAVQRGQIPVQEALTQLEMLPFQDVEAGRIDHHRAIRRGFPEVIFGEYKTPEQFASLFHTLAEKHEIVLGTRASQEHADATIELQPDARYDKLARCVYRSPEHITNRGRGRVCVVCAGTADLPVAREAVITATLMGNHTSLIKDVGVAGLQRILDVVPKLREAEALIVVAGMEGALPSVVGGLCDRPLIAVPTSVGYGTSQGGWAALFGMLSACTAGITVVNIDNGFGAGYAASLLNRKRKSPTALDDDINIATLVSP